ncbi:MAG: PD40 domain-containing protein [Gemmatimonadetes bacterium]|nr:PD40 domain-containing protein [Gemmatimonadota bacterium]
MIAHRARDLLVATLGVASCLAAATAGAQQNPPGIAWRVLRTPHFEVIHPRELAEEAQRVARRLERMAGPVSASMGGPPARIPLLLQNQGVASNGFVTLAPRRSEWFGTPPQDRALGANEWFDLLGAHEYRHVAQFERTKVGFTGFMATLFGEPGWSFMSDLALPPWFWEGDAVGEETALTASGRGRQPDFDMELRALVLGAPRADYWTAVWRSYDRFVPDYYQFGYGLVSYVKLTQGAAAWDSIVTRAARNAWYPWSFSAAMRSVTGRGAAETYGAAMDSLAREWRARRSPLPQTAVAPLSGLDARNFTWTESPQFTGDGRVIAFRRGIDLAYAIVEMPAVPTAPADTNAVRAAGAVNDSAVVRTLFTPAPYSFGVPHSVAGTSMAWAAIAYDLRWGRREWSEVRVTDLATGVTRAVTRGTRLFAPALSPDGRRIAAVEFTTGRRSAIAILDATTGAVLSRLPNPRNAFLQLPRWSPDGAHLVYVRVDGDSGRAIAWTDVATGAERIVVGPTADNVMGPVTDGVRVYYSSPRNGVDNVHATDLATGRSWQVTNRPVAALGPALSPDGRTLAFTEMTAFGEIVVTAPVDTGAWTPLERAPRQPFAWAEALAVQEGGIPARDTAHAAFPEEPYSAAGHALNFFGLTAYASPFEARTSLSLVSRDLLGTTAVAVGVRGNTNERTVDVGASVTYAGWWPVLTASLWRNQRQSDYLRASDTTIVTYNWTELEATLGVRFPFNLTRGRYDTRLSVGATVSARRTTDTPVAFRVAGGDQLRTRGTFLPVTWDLSFGRGYATYRDLQPVWGQYLSVSLQQTPLGRGIHSGSLLAARGFFYFPGFVRHHGILLDVEWERQEAGNYFFSSQVNFPRGYGAVSFDRFTKVGWNYAFPIAYPDAHLLGAAQVQRLRGTLYHDYGRGELLPSTAFPATSPRAFTYNSSGIEVMADTRWWQLPAPVGIGVRVGYLHELRAWTSGLLLQLAF